MKDKFYSLDKILKLNATYNIIFGQRSNGKTTSVLWHGLREYLESGGLYRMAYIRRWEEDFKGQNGAAVFSGIVALGWIQKLTKNRWNGVYYWSRAWYLCKYDNKGDREETDSNPFCWGFSITSQEHYKSTSFPNVKTILFDEFITRGYYIPNEFTMFINLISTIVRSSGIATIFMCGNTVSKQCPYFAEMNLRNVKDMKQGTIDLYKSEKTSQTIAVEFCENKKSVYAESDKYFDFENPQLQMITTGVWEVGMYPHCPTRFKSADIKYSFYILSYENVQGEVVRVKDGMFIYLHRKTTPIKEDDKRLCFTTEVSHKKNYRVNIYKPMLNTAKEKVIALLFRQEKVFYQDNEVGEIVYSYLKTCSTANL